MNVDALKLFKMVRGISNSDIARASGVSRQAVSLWFSQNDEQINIGTKNLMNLCSSFMINPQDILLPINIYSKRKYLNEMETSFLWDKLYPSLELFLIDVARCEKRAVARLVQVFGLFESYKMIGKKIWNDFPDYKKYITPKRRIECEKIWNIWKNQNLN